MFSNVERAYDQASIAGYGGTLAFTRTVSADGLEITLSANSAALASHDWACAEYELYAKVRSTVENLDSRYDPSCDCWYVTSLLDSIESGGKVIYFDGFPVTPPPPPPPPPCTVPTLVGRTLGQAESALNAAHRSLGRLRRAYSPIVRNGRVIS